MPQQDQELLIDREKFLAAGVHIGTKSSHVDMEPYIFRTKDSKLAVLDLETTDQKIREIAEMLAEYEPEDILVVGRKEEAWVPIEKFSESVGSDHVIGRFTPGMLTNPRTEKFTEPEVVIVTDPEQDSQAITEAAQTNKTVVAIADSGDSLDSIDYVIPANNKSGKAIGVVYYLLASETLSHRGEELDLELDDFQVEIEDDDEEE